MAAATGRWACTLMHAPVIDSAPARATMASFGRDAGLVSSDRTIEQVSFRALIGMPSHRRYLHASRTPCQESSFGQVSLVQKDTRTWLIRFAGPTPPKRTLQVTIVRRPGAAVLHVPGTRHPAPLAPGRGQAAPSEWSAKREAGWSGRRRAAKSVRPFVRHTTRGQRAQANSGAKPVGGTV